MPGQHVLFIKGDHRERGEQENSHNHCMTLGLGGSSSVTPTVVNSRSQLTLHCTPCSGELGVLWPRAAMVFSATVRCQEDDMNLENSMETDSGERNGKKNIYIQRTQSKLESRERKHQLLCEARLL